MLDLLQGKASDRKLRLFLLACCRRMWHLFSHENTRRAVIVAEWDVEGETNREIVGVAAHGVGPHHPFFGMIHACAAEVALTGQRTPLEVVLTGQRTTKPACGRKKGVDLNAVSFAADGLASGASQPDDEHRAQTVLLRDIFRNPFRAVIPGPWLRKNNPVGVAQAIYSDCAFDRLPILADALEDAGCDNVDILNHCRQPGEHVRGCWVVDLILGKE
jgi:hypothetical protein